MITVKEDVRRKFTLGVVIVGWSGTLAIPLLTVLGLLDPMSRWARIGALFIVIAIWGAIARSRYILSDTIVSVFNTAFRAGQEAARKASQEDES